MISILDKRKLEGAIKMKRLLFALFGVFPISLCGQINDFQGWYSLTCKAEIGKKSSIILSNESRFFNNAISFRKNLFEVGYNYECTKSLNTTVFVRLTSDDPLRSNRINTVRYFAQFSAKKETGRVEWGARLRIGSDEDDQGDLSWEHREKVSIDYNLKGLPLNLGLSCEFFFPFSAGMPLAKARYMAGLEWKIKKQHRMGLSYGWQHRFLENAPENAFILGVDYRYVFKLKSKK